MSSDPDFYNPKVQRWRFVLVPKGMRTLKIKYSDGRETTPVTCLAGHERWLGLNTRVLYKTNRKGWHLMFWLALYRGVPSIKYGQMYGPYPDQWRSLSRLPAAAHLNAGIDPAKEAQ